MNLYGLYVGSEIVLTVTELPKRGYDNYDWDKIRDAVWSKFGAYDKPGCNPLISDHKMTHNGINIYFKELPV